MLRVTSGAFHEKLSAGNDEIILNGPPGDLRGYMSVRNQNGDTLKVKSLPLYQDKNLSRSADVGTSLSLSCRLNPGEEKVTEVWHQLSSQTAPGTYENTIMVGGESRTVKMIVQEQISIDIFPRHFTFRGTAAGVEHTAVITVVNTGNVPFQVPDVKHVAALDMDFLCRAFGMGMRNGGSEGVIKMLDEVTKNMQAHLADWADARIQENGHVIGPGEKSLIHLRITMPANSDSRKDYNGNVRLWDQDISYSVKAQ